jgi:hypothetical protein
VKGNIDLHILHNYSLRNVGLNGRVPPHSFPSKAQCPNLEGTLPLLRA